MNWKRLHHSDMKAFLTALLLIAAMTLAGWLTFTSTEETISVEVDKSEVKKDTGAAVEEGKELARELKESGEQAAESIDDSIDVHLPATDEAAR